MDRVEGGTQGKDGRLNFTILLNNIDLKRQGKDKGEVSV